MNNFIQNQPMNSYQEPQQPQTVITYEPPKGGSLFSGLRAQPITVYDSQVPAITERKPRRKKKKDDIDVEVLDENGNVISKRDDIADLCNMDFEKTYKETTGMIRGTIMQLDILGGELKDDLEAVRASRTIRNKYNYITDLGQSISSIYGTKLQALKELNNTVKNINDMNYRKAKDMRAMEAGNDDKYIMDMYNAFVQSPLGTSIPNNMINMNDYTIPSKGNGGALSVDVGTTNMPGITAMRNGIEDDPMTNFTPLQKMMVYEQNPNIKQCVVYDKNTGNRWFKVMDLSTNTPIEDAPTRDPDFLKDTTLDLKNGIAKNTNLNEVYPLIILNDDGYKDF